jgi:hypothetical protein
MIKLDESSKEFKELKNEWLEEVKTINSKNKLDRFVKKVMTGYEHDYGTYVHAVSVCTKAFIRYYGSQMTGFQASFLMWDIIRNTFGKQDKLGLQLVEYECVLFPQLLYRLTVQFDDETHQKVIELAKKYLDEEKIASKEVREHWEKLASGWLPECVSLKRNNKSPKA